MLPNITGTHKATLYVSLTIALSLRFSSAGLSKPISRGFDIGRWEKAENWAITKDSKEMAKLTIPNVLMLFLKWGLSWLLVDATRHKYLHVQIFKPSVFGNYGQTMRLCTDLVKKRVGLKYIRNAKKMRILSAGKYLLQLVQYTHCTRVLVQLITISALPWNVEVLQQNIVPVWYIAPHTHCVEKYCIVLQLWLVLVLQCFPVALVAY